MQGKQHIYCRYYCDEGFSGALIEEIA